MPEIEIAHTHPEVFQTTRERLRLLRNLYRERGLPSEFAEIEEVAKEAYVALNRAALNMERLVELEREFNERRKGEREVRVAHALLSDLHALPGLKT